MGNDDYTHTVYGLITYASDLLKYEQVISWNQWKEEANRIEPMIVKLSLNNRAPTGLRFDAIVLWLDVWNDAAYKFDIEQYWESDEMMFVLSDEFGGYTAPLEYDEQYAVEWVRMREEYIDSTTSTSS